MTKPSLISLLMLLIIGGAVYYAMHTPAPEGGVVVESELTGKEDLIRVTSPRAGSAVTSPLTISGEARGNWFFEASFPVYVADWDGLIIGEGYATAEGEWMTSDFVPFTATITFDTEEIRGQYSDRGTLILKKANASGLPEHDDALEIPIILK